MQPAITLDDVIDAEVELKKLPDFQDFIAKRYGITDLNGVAIDPWYSGQRYGPTHCRLLQCFLYQRTSEFDNFYAHPLDAIVFFDFSAKRIEKITVYNEGDRQDVPLDPADFSRHLMRAPWRTGVRPLNVIQPEGPSFTIRGNAVEWQKWSFHLGFSWREGLIIYNLGYEDKGRVRPVLYRAALAEIIVPYAEPRAPYETKCAYDIMDYGLGFCANSLELGCDCLGAIAYFDADLNNARGEAITVKKAVCMHEEDVGIAFKHFDYRNGEVEVRRLRRLVISFIATIANYEYGFYWYLYQDGSIQFEAKLTGIVSTSPLHPDEAARGEPDFGNLVAPGVNAAHHQHFFLTRLDMCVDDDAGGRGLTVVEMDAVPMADEHGPNPHRHGFAGRETVLRTELQAQRNAAPELSRTWKVVNPRSVNPRSGKPVAWKLIPSWTSPPMLAGPGSDQFERGNFATKHLWVTPYAEDEMNPAGEYPHDPNPDANGGIRAWTAANRRVQDADVVLWYNTGLTHFVRTEDFPVMPVEQIGFHLKPYHFFDANPAMDIPPERNAKSVLAAPCCEATPLPSAAGPSKPRM